MSILNGTQERVGVEVSGPTGGRQPRPQAPIVLEPDEKLDNLDGFNNLKVKFYHIEGKNAGKGIATINFNDGDYTIAYHKHDTDVRKMTQPEKIVPDPIRINLRRLDPSHYSVDVRAKD